MTCPYCGKAFTPRVQHQNQVYCSDRCRFKNYQKTKPQNTYATKQREIALLLSSTDDWLKAKERSKLYPKAMGLE